MKISKKNYRQIKMNKFYKNKKIVIISMLILFGISNHAQINKKVNTKISTRNIKYNNIKVENNIPLLIATNKDIAKSISSTKINKKLAMKTAKSFNEKIPKDYRPSSGKLYRKLTAQKPFYNNAYLEFYEIYEPMKRTIKISNKSYYAFFVKFKPKINKNYLMKLKVKIDAQVINALSSHSTIFLYTRLGDADYSFKFDHNGSKIKAKEYEFEFVIQSKTYNWIQVPFFWGTDNYDSLSRSGFYWSFVSATISEL